MSPSSHSIVLALAMMLQIVSTRSQGEDNIAFDTVFMSRLVHKGCSKDGIVCRTIRANGFDFDIAFAGDDGKAGDVMMLPGHPESKEMFLPLMQQLAAKGYRSVAIDPRGYSQGARPHDKSAYNYNEIVKDIFAIADAIGFDKFHMVAHDQGARVSWHSIAVSEGRQKFLTFATLSIPHADVFSDAVHGDTADLQQQIAVQYVTTFTLPNSASLHDYYWFKQVRPPMFNSSTEYQRALWWYSGAIDSGNMAQAPIMSVEYLMGQRASSINPKWLDKMVEVRKLFGEESAYPKEGVPQTIRVGNVTMPILYVCGLSDVSDLCGRPYAKRSADYCLGGYRYIEVDCGHNVLECPSAEETQKVQDAIVDHILQHSLPSILV